MWGEWVGNEAYAYYADCLSALRERLYSLYLSMYIVYAICYVGTCLCAKRLSVICDLFLSHLFSAFLDIY